MPVALVSEILDELVATLENVVGQSTLGDDGFQVVNGVNWAPSEPAIDVYPAETFVTSEGAGFGEIGGALNFVVRARVGGDVDGRQALLYSLMDDAHDLSLVAALMDDQTLNGLASSVEVDGPEQFGPYTETLLGCQWRVTVLRGQS